MISKLHILHAISKQIIYSSVIPFAVILTSGIVLHIVFLYYLAAAGMILVGALVSIHGVTGFLITWFEFRKCKRIAKQGKEENSDN